MRTRWIIVFGLWAGLSLLVTNAAFAGDLAGMSLGDFVWVDTNEDGLQDEVGTGVNGVRVDLYAHYEDSTLVFIGSTTTATKSDSTPDRPWTGDGYYEFNGLELGEYRLVFHLPGGYKWTKQGPNEPGVCDPTCPIDIRRDVNDSDVAPSTGIIDWFWMGTTDGNYPKAGNLVDLDDWTRDAGLIETTFEDPGCGTPGYWKNHPDAWPVQVITIGGIDYSKAQAIGLMKKFDKKDMRYLMFMHLVSAKLNVIIGNSNVIIAPYIALGDEWMRTYAPNGLPEKSSAVSADSYAWQDGDGEDIKDMLDDYNNGLLDAPARD